MENYVWLIPVLPLAAFIITIILGKWWIKEQAHWLPILAMAASFGLSLAAFVQIRGAEEPVIVNLWQWFNVGSFQVPFALQVDQLSAVMLLVVTGVGLLIFIYSAGYMKGDPGYYRFFAYLSLFAFSMLMLVLADNYLLLYFGWEAVGLCSYYLIGFFYHKPEAAAAGKKAFIVNRVGDFGFGLGVMLIFVTFGTLQYTGVFEQVTRGRLRRGHDDRHRAAALHGRHGQVGPVPAARVAARRHGRSHSGVGPHPCRHHGHRRRLPGGAQRHHLRERPGHPPRRGGDRHASPPSSRPSSASARRTSRRSSPTPRSRSSATCSWPSAWGRGRSPSSTW